MAPYLLLFLAGFAGSFHCIGMCGGFACALGRDARGSLPTVGRHLLYNSGRLTSYCFLGALAGAAGQVICASTGALALPLLGGAMDAGQRVLAIAAGLLMIVVALQFLGFAKGLHRWSVGFGGRTLATVLGRVTRSPGPTAPLALGVFNGFLPCPLVYAFLAQAASTSGVVTGVLTMAAFGLGTFPAMLMAGSIGGMLSPLRRRRGVLIAGSFILALGLVTLGRGVLPPGLLHWGHEL